MFWEQYYENTDMQRTQREMRLENICGTWDEMVRAMTKQVIKKHPDVAKRMEKMHNEDPKKKWGYQTEPKWDAAPET
jgi:hypothetical protein